MVRAIERGETPVFSDMDGVVGLLDEQHQPLGERQPCRFSSQTGPGAWQAVIHTQHQFDLSALLPKQASYVCIYAANKDELMFTLPMAHQPKRRAVRHIICQWPII